MASFGRFEPFTEEGDEDFDSYAERFEHYVRATQVSEDLKVSVFVTAIGKQAYRTLKNLLAPTKPEEKTYDELLQILKGHYSPKPLVIAERFRFNRRSQRENESVAAFALELKRLAGSCEFGQFLDDALRDRFVAGLRDETAQAELLKKSTLTFQAAYDLAKSGELARTETRKIHPKELGDVNLVRPHHPQRSTGTKRGVSGNAERHAEATDCSRCGAAHDATTCPFRKYRCRACKKVGHLARVCRTTPRSVHSLIDGTGLEDSGDWDDKSGENEVLLSHIFSCRSSHGGYAVKVKIAGRNVTMQVDTGASVSIVPEKMYRQYWPNVPLERCSLRLKTYGGSTLAVAGKLTVHVEHDGQTETLPLIVVRTEKNCDTLLLGRNWLEALKLNWASVCNINFDKANTHDRSAALIEKFSEVFNQSLGLIADTSVKLVLKDSCTPVFCKHRPVPFALRNAVASELQSLVESGVLVPVKHSEWATPLVVVPKANNKVRICGDYKVTLNRCLRTDYYPLPTMEDTFVALHGCKWFTVLDLSTAYQQLQLHPESQPLVTVNTHLGLFQYTRMPYGITSAPSIFQAVMDDMLKGLDRVSCYLDDVLIAGETMEECYDRVEAVLTRFQERGVKLRKEKCKFFEKSVTYLGHVIGESGIRPSEDKVRAIKEAPTPKNKNELRAYLGLINFYGKFVPNMSAQLKPLHDLLAVNAKWEWTEVAEKAFKASKSWLLSTSVLTYYNPSRELGLVCDASAYGLGAVLFHKVGSEERPIAFASRTLTKTEQAYAHIEKEALAVVYGLKKFHKYLFGRKFVIYSDHQPLAGLLGEDRPIPAMSAARVQRWALQIAAYEYKWVYRKSRDIGNADALSRLPLRNSDDVSEYIGFSMLDELPLSAEHIRRETRTDSLLSKVLFYTQSGWPSKVSDDALAPYFVRRHELSVDRECVTWGNRVIVPLSLRDKVLSLLHEGHPGMARMKMLSRSHVWWPRLTPDVEQKVKECVTCQLTQNAAPKVPVMSWGVAGRRWERVHLDFAHRDQHWFLVLIDSYSKWVEVFLMRSTNSEKTIEKLRTVFAAYGLPEEVVTDNGPQFTSELFETFMSRNGIRHTKSPPYHPASNGSAERCVQTLKKNLLKQVMDEQKNGRMKSLQQRIDQFLFNYRNTPTGVTEETPAQLFLSWKPRTRLSFLHPDIEQRMKEKLERTRQAANRRRGAWRDFEEGEDVLVQGLRPGEGEWLSGKVKKRESLSTYVIGIGNEERYVHVDHMRPRTFQECFPPSVQVPSANYELPACTQDVVPRRSLGAPVPIEGARETADPDQVEEQAEDTNKEPVNLPGPSSAGGDCGGGETQSSPPELPELRRSTRQRRPPDRY